MGNLSNFTRGTSVLTVQSANTGGTGGRPSNSAVSNSVSSAGGVHNAADLSMYVEVGSAMDQADRLESVSNTPDVPNVPDENVVNVVSAPKVEPAGNTVSD